ncbi:hypothetical protein F5148DRAFT_1146961 [Russula earlei]|uniref:Uncharacterized protein n=1 Tax=Russula earlei TaxID=71964 RepID=A0ACC0UI17_9AGAM|nr:hypothetical protein F5148DRAFT_1146961 [Russula earlei]
MSGQKPVDEGYAADFTNIDKEKVVVCEREGCPIKTFPPGTDTFYLHSNDPSQGGRKVCWECYQYYKQKEDNKVQRYILMLALHRSSVDMATAEHQHMVHQQPVGFAYSNPILPTGSLQGFQAHHLVQSTNGPVRMASTTPIVQLPGKQSHQAFPVIWSTGGVLAGSSGYTKNHLSYQLTRQTLANNAYALHGGHVVIVEVQAVHMPVGKTKVQLIGDILQAVDNVPVHIGAVELKHLLYEHLLSIWNAYTDKYPLAIDDIIMRTKDWVEIKPLNLDQDVISHQFFKSRKGGLMFKLGCCTIFFHIPNVIYQQYLDDVERKEMERVQEVSWPDLAVQVRVEHGQGSGTVASSFDVNTVSSTSASPPPKRMHVNTKLETSPTISRQLGNALQSQNSPTLRAARRLFETKSMNVTTYLVVHHTLEELLQSHQEDFDHKQYLGPARDMTLQLDFSPSKQKKGGFKLAMFGTTSQDIFGAGFEVCAKQTFYAKKATIDSTNQDPIKITQNIPHNGVTQVCNLMMEIACLSWAHILLNLIYKFVDKGIALHGLPPFLIPPMHFVEAALAVEHVTTENSEARAFLLEEVIGGNDGHFRKYLKFLAFLQHVQYFKTKKLAFVANYQGSNSVLSDPQIVTDRWKPAQWSSSLRD